MIRLQPARWRSQWRLFVAVVLVGCFLRLGYGVARYHDEFSRTGQDFVLFWDYDALEHVLIAKSLIEEGAYRVGDAIDGTEIRFGPNDALFKAPLYQYFLAGVFAVSGFSFALFFPLQALIGGLAAGLAALIALELFGRWRIAAFSGLAVAAHPILVNSASQPYNENLFIALTCASTWAFVRWVKAPHMAWALAAGVMGGLATLCRESALPLLVVMAAFALVTAPAGARRSITAACVMVGVAILMILPWSVRNFLRIGEIVPVSAISGTALSIGNNECVAEAPLLTLYWADDPCEPLNVKRAEIYAHIPAERFYDRVVRNRINAGLATTFIKERPLDYLKLSAQRAWTTLLPYHPQRSESTSQRLILLAYWLAVYPAGLVGMIIYRGWAAGRWLLIALLIATLAPLVLVYVSPDMRYRIPADLVFAWFAAPVYADVLQRIQRLSSRLRPRRSGRQPLAAGSPVAGGA